MIKPDSVLINVLNGTLMKLFSVPFHVFNLQKSTQNIDTLGPIWTFSHRGVLTFEASGLDINGCVELF